MTDQYYLDSSALVKRYVAEIGTDWISCLCAVEAENTVYTARMTGAEIAAALFRKVRERTLAVSDAQAAVVRFKADFRRRYQIVEITDELVETAMNLVERHALRGYDAVSWPQPLNCKARGCPLLYHQSTLCAPMTGQMRLLKRRGWSRRIRTSTESTYPNSCVDLQHMSRKLFRSGNSTVVSIPPEVLEVVGLRTGDNVTIVADVDQQRIIITPVTPHLPDIREDLLD